MDQRPQIFPADLVALINGDKQAYASVYRAYYERLYNYGCKFTKDYTLVEDCIQEVMTAFWINREKIAGVTAFESYLFVSFRNRLMKSLKQGSLRWDVLFSDEYDFEFELSIDQVMITADRVYEQHINITAALKQLTQRQKEVIYFKFYENLSYEQISGILNITTKATYKLVARAIGELRTVYREKSSTFSLLPLIPLALTIA